MSAPTEGRVATSEVAPLSASNQEREGPDQRQRGVEVTRRRADLHPHKRNKHRECGNNLMDEIRCSRSNSLSEHENRRNDQQVRNAVDDIW